MHHRAVRGQSSPPASANPAGCCPCPNPPRGPVKWKAIAADEDDSKYESFPFDAVGQVDFRTNEIRIGAGASRTGAIGPGVSGRGFTPGHVLSAAPPQMAAAVCLNSAAFSDL